MLQPLQPLRVVIRKLESCVKISSMACHGSAAAPMSALAPLTGALYAREKLEKEKKEKLEKEKKEKLERGERKERQERGKERILLDHHFLTLCPTISLVKSSKLF